MRRASPDNEVGTQHKPRRVKCLMGVGGGSTAGAWVTYRRARACAWSASRRIERVSNIPRNELFRAALAVILRARERLRDVDGGQAHLDTILRHMGDLHELNWDLLGQDYDRYSFVYDVDDEMGASRGREKHPCFYNASGGF